MTAQDLAKHARDYLAAIAATASRRAEGKDDREERERQQDVREGLAALANQPYPPAAEPLMTAVRELLHAEESVERCRSFGTDSDAASRLLDHSTRALKDVLDDRELRDAILERALGAASAGGHVRRVLVAVDDSCQAEWALQIAVRHARDIGASLVLLHVVMPELGVAEDFIAAQRLEALHRRQGRELLEKLQRLVPPTVPSSRMLRTGFAAEDIVSIARDLNAEVIVIGTRGRGRLTRFLMGSTAEAVVRKATCPVLTVSHEPPKERCADEAEWIGVGADLATPEAAHAGVGPASR